MYPKYIVKFQQFKMHFQFIYSQILIMYISYTVCIIMSVICIFAQVGGLHCVCVTVPNPD